LKTEILDVYTFGEKPKKLGENEEKKPKKNRYFTKIEPYLYEFVAN
jgi:nucleoside-specific outer membrane channel protein Tsx